jgi:metal-responsive CopG/Arc/MetJ family transcriptional regulator
MSKKEKVKKREVNYTTVTVPHNLMARVDSIVSNEKYGYQNRSDFIFEAVRKRLRELGALE